MLCGKLRLGEIARETALTAATTSDAVSTLESKGLVEKRRALDDGRALALRLTARGRTAAKRAAQCRISSRRQSARDEERSLFYRTLLKTVRQLEVQGHIPPDRMCVTCVHLEPGKNPKKSEHHCALLDLSMADTDLRLDCPVHETADAATQKKTWKIFAQQG
jgi:DNA-binding MarR family transcriptional regulator